MSWTIAHLVSTPVLHGPETTGSPRQSQRGAMVPHALLPRVKATGEQWRLVTARAVVTSLGIWGTAQRDCMVVRAAEPSSAAISGLRAINARDNNTSEGSRLGHVLVEGRAEPR